MISVVRGFEVHHSPFPKNIETIHKLIVFFEINLIYFSNNNKKKLQRDDALFQIHPYIIYNALNETLI